MNLEVEQKFAADELDPIAEKIEQLGGSFADGVFQRDLYLSHPSRDFSATDEAFRLRRVASRNWLTYKGPKLDQTTKTRQEIEVAMAEGDKAAQDAIELLGALAFTSVAEVCKFRRTASLRQGRFTVEIALDEVEKVGSFVELELIAPEEAADAARAAIATLARELGLVKNVREGYLELLLAGR